MPNEYDQPINDDEMNLEPQTPSASNVHGKLANELEFGDADDTTVSVLRGVAEYDQEGFDNSIMGEARTQNDTEVLEMLRDMNNEFSDERMAALKADLDRSWNPTPQTREHGRADSERIRGYQYSPASSKLGLRPINRGRGRLR